MDHSFIQFHAHLHCKNLCIHVQCSQWIGKVSIHSLVFGLCAMQIQYKFIKIQCPIFIILNELISLGRRYFGYYVTYTYTKYIYIFLHPLKYPFCIILASQIGKRFRVALVYVYSIKYTLQCRTISPGMASSEKYNGKRV